MPKANREYWQHKLRRNQERDALNCAGLQALGWNVLVVWECETKEAALLERRLRDFLEPGTLKRKEPELAPKEQYRLLNKASKEAEVEITPGRLK